MSLISILNLHAKLADGMPYAHRKKVKCSEKVTTQPQERAQVKKMGPELWSR